MNPNKKAQKFKGRAVQTALHQSNDNANTLERLQKVMFAQSVTILNLNAQLEKAKAQLNVTMNRARNADFRSAALMELLSEGAAVTKEAVTARFVELQLKEFEEGSKLHDEENKLENAAGPAEKGMHAILTAKLFKEGVEQTDEQVLRSKVELGKDELFKTLDDVIVGMNIGDTRRATVETDYGIREVEVSLLGLRKATPQPETATEQTQEQTQA